MMNAPPGTLLIVGSTHMGSLTSSYLRAFRRLGWNVHVWDPAQALRKVVRGGRAGHLVMTFLGVEPWLIKANVSLIQQAVRLRPTLILVVALSYVRFGTVEQIRACMPNTPIYGLFPDSPHRLTTNAVQCVPALDRLATSSSAWVAAFQRLGIERVQYLPFAADTDLHYPVPQSSQRSPFARDVLFVGNWRDERETILEQLIDFDLGIWGTPYWHSKTRRGSPLRRHWGGKPLIGQDFAQACADAKIMLNIHDAATLPGPNMRSFEQPACRAFSLVDRTPAILDIFTEDTNIVCFDTVAEAREKIQYYANHESARQRIAQASYELVVSQGHTYLDRAQQIIAWAREDGYSVA
jgi:spore maturation protein CgeB